MIGGLTNRFSARIGLLSSLLPYELQEFRGANEEETEILFGPSRPRNFPESSRHFRKPGLLANLNDDFGLDRRFSAERGNTHRRAGMLAPLVP